MIIQSVSVDVSPFAIGDRLRKIEQSLTENNMHDEAFIVGLAASVMRAMAEDKLPRRE